MRYVSFTLHIAFVRLSE